MTRISSCAARMVALVTFIGAVVGYPAVHKPILANTEPALSAVPAPPARPSSTYGALAAAFVANRGQTDPLVRFVAHGGGVPIFFTDSDVRFVVNQRGRRTAVVLELTGVGAGVKPEARRPTGGVVTYIKPSSHDTLPAYGEILYRGAWPRIDARFHGERGALKYEFIIAPGGRVDDVRLRIRGTDSVIVNERGELAMAVGGGTIVDRAPDTFQMIAGQRRSVPSRFISSSTGEVSFSVGAYDHTRPLVIDPSIVYSTFLGSADDDEARGVAVDASGAAYVTGDTNSPGFPTTAGAYATSGGVRDGFVAKITPAGDRFEYVTFLGGSGSDNPLGIRVDAAGNAYVGGMTDSTDFPTTAGAFRSTIGAAGNSDGFVTKLNPTGTALVWSTYLGGNAWTQVHAIALDSLDQAYVVGQTYASNLTTTSGAVETSHVSVGKGDAFLLKFNASGSSVVYGTYLGGSGGDGAWAVAVDETGAAYTGGTTDSQDLRTSVDAPRRTPIDPPGGLDAWVAKIDTLSTQSANALLYGSYIGGTGFDSLRGIAVDSTHSAYLAIQSSSYNDFPLTEPERLNATVVMKMNPAGTAFDYSRAIGPTYRGYTIVEALAIDAAGNAYVTGSSDDEANYAWISLVDPNGFEASRAVLAPSPSQFTDWPYGIAVDAARNVYVVGRTASVNFPVTEGAAQTTFGGRTDAFITKLTFADVPATNVASGAHAVASSVEGPEYAANNAVDGSLSTRWSSEFSDPQWIYVDLGERKQIERVVLHWETAYARFYQVQVSDDAVSWSPLVPGTIESDGHVDNFFDLTGAGQYVRVYGTARATEWGYSLWEIEVFGRTAGGPPPPPASTNLARGRFTNTSSIERSTETYYYGQNAVDGRDDTRWSSEFSDPQWIYVDLGQTIDISRVVLKWETAYGADYQIQVSSDAKNWTTIRSVTDGDGGVDDLTGLTGSGRFVRMFGTRRGTEWGYSLWEFEVYGAVAQTPADIVLYASDALENNGRGWVKVSDPASPNGIALLSPDTGYASLDAPPPLFDAEMKWVDFSFVVPTAGAYKVWLRLKATGNSKYNDSVWVQFSQATVDGVRVYDLGSQDALLVNLEDCSGCGVSGWGWQDNAWWLTQPTVIALPQSGWLRVMVREDGVMLDQIVLSPVRFMNEPPGPVKNDATIVPK